MASASVTTLGRSGIVDRPVLAPPSVQTLRRMLEQRRQRRLDRVVAQTVQALDHAGIAEDYRAACRHW